MNVLKLMSLSLVAFVPFTSNADTDFNHRIVTCTMSGDTARAIAKKVSYSWSEETKSKIEKEVKSGYLYLAQAYREGDKKASPQYKVFVRFSTATGKDKYKESNRFTIDGQNVNFAARTSLVHQNGVYAFSYSPYKLGQKRGAFTVLASAEGSGISFNPREQVGSRLVEDYPLFCRQSDSPVEGATPVDWTEATDEQKVADMGLFYQRSYRSYARRSRIGTEDAKVKELTEALVAGWEKQATEYMNKLNPLYLSSYGYDEAPGENDLIEGALEGGTCGEAKAHNFFRIEDFTGQLLGFNVEFACSKAIAQFRRKLTARKLFIPAGTKDIPRASFEAAIYHAGYGTPGGVFW